MWRALLLPGLVIAFAAAPGAPADEGAQTQPPAPPPGAPAPPPPRSCTPPPAPPTS